MGRAAGVSESTSIGVLVDGAKVPLYGPSMTVRHDTSALRFLVNPKSPRVRYKLASLDPDWKERTAEMFFIIRFQKRNGDQISQEVFPAVGTSPGWKGSLEKSDFTPRRETGIVPAGATTFSSVGPPTLVEVFEVSGISIQSNSSLLLPKAMPQAGVGCAVGAGDGGHCERDATVRRIESRHNSRSLPQRSPAVTAGTLLLVGL